MSDGWNRRVELSQVTYEERMLPSQPFQRSEFDGSEQDFYAALYEMLQRFSGSWPDAEAPQLQTVEEFPLERMASSPMELRLLELLILLKRPRRILEIGTFIGLSALSMARVLPEGGQVVTIEKYDRFARLARRNFFANGLDHKIQLIQGDAFNILQRFEATERFDMAFLDGNKERYGEYVALLDPFLSPGGLLVVDDVLYDGEVLNAQPKTAKGLGVKAFLDVAQRRRDYQKALLPIGCGMMLLMKRA